MDIENLRKEIDLIDEQILCLFINRLNYCKKIAKIKKENNLSITNLKREADILSSILKSSSEYQDEAWILFKNIIDISKNVQIKYIQLNNSK